MARGVDLILSYKTPSLYLYLTYGLAQVTRTDSITRGGVLQARTYAPVWDRRHNVNFVASYKTGKYEFYEKDGRRVMPKIPRTPLGNSAPAGALAPDFPSPRRRDSLTILTFDQNGAQTPVVSQNGSLNIPAGQ